MSEDSVCLSLKIFCQFVAEELGNKFLQERTRQGLSRVISVYAARGFRAVSDVLNANTGN